MTGELVILTTISVLLGITLMSILRTMTRVMDGLLGEVRGIAPSLSVPATRRPRPDMKPINAATSRATAGVRYVTGMDGVRRAMRPTTPRQVLATVVEAPVVTPQPVAKPAPTPARTATPARPSFWRRSVVTTSLVLMALVTAGGTTLSLQTERSVVADSQVPTPTNAAVTATPSPTPKSGLQELLNNFNAKHPGIYSIVVKDLKTGQTATIDPKRQVTSASLYKLYVAERIYRLIDTGQLRYTDAAGYGTGRTIEGCLRVMINVSDNACGRALGERLGWGKQNTALARTGYSQTSLTTLQQTSAADTALLFERLWLGRLASAGLNQDFLNLLKDQRVNNRLPIGLPAGTLIAHKTGDLFGYLHDGGIVYGPTTTYIVVVTGKPGSNPAHFADLSRQLWNFFK